MVRFWALLWTGNMARMDERRNPHILTGKHQGTFILKTKNMGDNINMNFK
jgi:hypothetical protein